jgi:hypothetical protein
MIKLMSNLQKKFQIRLQKLAHNSTQRPNLFPLSPFVQPYNYTKRQPLLFLSKTLTFCWAANSY